MKDNIKKMLDRMPANSTHLKMQVQGSSETLALIRRVIAASVQHLKLAAATLNDIKLATTEACTNVIKHAYKFDDSMSFELEIKTSAEIFAVEVFYEDPGFIPENIPVPDLKEIKEGGLGVFIIRNIMDHVDYQTDQQTGKVKLLMVKILNKEGSIGGQSED
ncbi:MAG: ATP-binding protein [Candidatus Rifleibacteriota bacterium]